MPSQFTPRGGWGSTPIRRGMPCVCLDRAREDAPCHPRGTRKACLYGIYEHYLRRLLPCRIESSSRMYRNRFKTVMKMETVKPIALGIVSAIYLARCT